MSKTAQLQVLREEARVLKDIAAKLQDQLRRLKVEELTLVNQIRSVDENNKSEEEENTNIEVMNQPENPSNVDMDESEINYRPLLDLDVTHSAFPKIGGAQEVEEEEEDDEDEYDEDEPMDNHNLHDQLSAFVQKLERESGQQ